MNEVFKITKMSDDDSRHLNPQLKIELTKQITIFSQN